MPDLPIEAGISQINYKFGYHLKIVSNCSAVAVARNYYVSMLC